MSQLIRLPFFTGKCNSTDQLVSPVKQISVKELLLFNRNSAHRALYH